ncbi:Hypothetical protein GbCGDNIH9_1629a [Granulibacter bethesdensis]|uniref:Uncharacterized protein n=1 Tax=Granulibacter bethesdensis TaxID=364410 RepID=A0AAC9VMR5_9PROT|nr:Hypothetical protein GbCGDNIH9_1629a [Granulibacter bethesdensis]
MKGKRSISAHAEEPRATDHHHQLAGVYLRARGGTPLVHTLNLADLGLSPRTRRNR